MGEASSAARTKLDGILVVVRLGKAEDGHCPINLAQARLDAHMKACEAWSLRSCHSYLNTRHLCFIDSFRCNRAGEPGAESTALLLAPLPSAVLLAYMHLPAGHVTSQLDSKEWL